MRSRVWGRIRSLAESLRIARYKTLITLIICVWVYGLVLGWHFAVGFVALLFVHEMGHVIALRMLGIKATAPMFIPFMGAIIGMKQRPDNAFAEAVMAYGGPLLGTLGAIVCAGIGLLTHDPFWYILAMAGFLLNLFNLLPISPLDGGRIIGVVSPRLWIVGLFGAFALFYLTWSPLIALIIIIGSLQIRSSKKRSYEERVRYYAAPGTGYTPSPCWRWLRQWSGWAISAAR